MSDALGLGMLFLGGVLAGGINAIAGGGTIITFAMLAGIMPPGPGRLVTANVSSKIGLWPGAAAAAWASRSSREDQPASSRWLLVPGVLGAVIGVALLRWLPSEAFDAVVPWLILLAASLFAAQPHLARLAVAAARRPSDSATSPDRPPGPARMLAASGLQLLVGIYGGYFGAGIGILMLAVLAVLGLGDIHRLNAVKNLLAAAVNGVATAVLVAAGFSGLFQVSWPHVAVLAAGSVAGGIAVARLLPRLPAVAVRRLVAIIGFALAGYYFWREWNG